MLPGLMSFPLLNRAAFKLLADFVQCQIMMREISKHVGKFESYATKIEWSYSGTFITLTQ